MNNTNTQEKILAAAENLIQTQGYNAFSYKDISAVVGIKTSSIHYYYPTKEDLAIAVLEWQIDRFSIALNDIKNKTQLSTKQKLLAMVDQIVTLTFADEMKMCLGGMLASELHSLPVTLQAKVRSFFDVLQQWIRTILIEGKQLGNMKLSYPKEKFPLYLILQIEGALLMSRLYQQIEPINTVKQFIKDMLG